MLPCCSLVAGELEGAGITSHNLPLSLGRYVLLERIAVGGMAEVFKARSRSLGGFEKILAIKRLHAKFCEDQEFIRMLIEEARLAVQLNHINIGQIFDLERIGESYFICMEYIDGPDLYKILRRCDESGFLLPIEAAAFLTMEVCHGLDYAHRKKDERGRPLRIAHRDISPQNIIISYEGEVKIVDFGIAKAAQRNFDTAIGVIKGKFYYMSPEQASGDHIDHRTDIFSTGIVLYEMLTGTLMYRTDDDASLLSRVRRAQFEPPRAIRGDVPRELERIVLKALARSPEQRYASALEMGSALQSFLFSVGSQYNKARLGAFLRELFGREDGAPPPPDWAASSMSRDDIGPSPSSLLRFEPPPTSRASSSGSGRARPAAAPYEPLPPTSRSSSSSGSGWPRPAVEPYRSAAAPHQAAPLTSQPSAASQLPAASQPPATTPPPAAPWSPAPAPSAARSRVPTPALPPAPYPPLASPPSLAQALAPASPTMAGRSWGAALAPVVAQREGEGPGGRAAGLGPGAVPSSAGPAAAAAEVDDDDETTVYLGAEDRPTEERPPLDQPPALALAMPAEDEDSSFLFDAPTVERSGELAGPLAAPLPAAAAGDDAPTLRPRQALPVFPATVEGGARPALFAPAGVWPGAAGGPVRQPAVRHVLTYLAILSGILCSGWLISFCSHSIFFHPQQAVSARATPAGLPAARAGAAAEPDGAGRTEPERHAGDGTLAGAGTGSSSVAPSRGVGRDGPARLEVVTRPLGARVELNGEPAPGLTPLTLELEPSRPYGLVLQLADHQTWTTSVRLEPGEERLLSVKLEPVLGQLEIHSRPAGAEVLMDDLPVGITPLQLGELPIAETPRLVLRRSGYQDLRTTVEWRGRRRVVLNLALTPLHPPRPRTEARPAAAARPTGDRRAASALHGLPDAPRPAALPPRAAGMAYLTVLAIPWGRVLMDGQEIAPETPMVRKPVPAGRHLVQVYFPSLGQQSPARLVDLKPDQEQKLLFGRE